MTFKSTTFNVNCVAQHFLKSLFYPIIGVFEVFHQSFHKEKVLTILHKGSDRTEDTTSETEASAIESTSTGSASKSTEWSEKGSHHYSNSSKHRHPQRKKFHKNKVSPNETSLSAAPIPVHLAFDDSMTTKTQKISDESGPETL